MRPGRGPSRARPARRDGTVPLNGANGIETEMKTGYEATGGGPTVRPSPNGFSCYERQRMLPRWSALTHGSGSEMNDWMAHVPRRSASWLVLAALVAAVIGCSGGSETSEVARCMNEIRRLSRETGQPSGSEDAMRRACERANPTSPSIPQSSVGAGAPEESDSISNACRLARVATDSLTTYARDRSIGPGAVTRDAWERAYARMLAAIVETHDARLQEGARAASPGLGATPTDPAMAGLDQIAARCDEVGTAFDDVASTGTSTACANTDPAIVNVIRAMIPSAIDTGSFQSAIEFVRPDFKLEFISARVKAAGADGIATWARLTDGSTVWSVDWRANKLTALEGRRSHRQYGAYGTSRSCAAEAGPLPL